MSRSSGILTTAVVLGWSWFVFDMLFLNPGGSAESINGTAAAFSAAAREVMGVIPYVMGAIIGTSLLLSVGPHVHHKAKQRKQYDLLTFGERRETHHYQKSAQNFTDKRCLNCSKALSEDGGVKNVAEEWRVIAGFKTSRNHRVETFECHECHEASWFDYAMRSGKFDSELLEPPEDEPEVDASAVESNDTPNPEGPECPICGSGPFKNEHGRNVHIGQSHPNHEIRDGVVCLKDGASESHDIGETEQGNTIYLTGDGTENHD